MIAGGRAEANGGASLAILRAVRRDLFAEKEQFFYEVTFDWPGMPTQTRLIDLGREVTVGFHLSEAPETDE